MNSNNYSLKVMVGNSTTSKNTREMPEAQQSLTQIQENISPDLEKENWWCWVEQSLSWKSDIVTGGPNYRVPS